MSGIASTSTTHSRSGVTSACTDRLAARPPPVAACHPGGLCWARGRAELGWAGLGWAVRYTYMLAGFETMESLALFTSYFTGAVSPGAARPRRPTDTHPPDKHTNPHFSFSNVKNAFMCLVSSLLAFSVSNSNFTMVFLVSYCFTALNLSYEFVLLYDL